MCFSLGLTCRGHFVLLGDSLHLTISFLMLGKFSTIISSKFFSVPFFFSSSSGTPITQILVHLILSQRSLQRRQWQPTPVLLPGKSHGWRSLVDCGPWGRWVGHDWATSLSLFTFMHWRRKWQPTPVFLPGESQGQGSLVGCRLWGRTELDMTEAT